ncbi:hypothetical protein [Clostridium sp. Marseille-P299]|uniref:hypothetical protein n=1 Tax=Clostridium sp. Marseille-P299 TaxID=1805477 RepID=UPI000834E8FD|nr:hypothetical protein [Clostridium sp. Marseille-P299]
MESNHIKNAENEKRIQKTGIKIIILFFVAMFFLTILSRVADSLTIPVVTVGKAGKETLEFKIEGTGTLVSDENTYIKVPEGVKIDRVKVKSGQAVIMGETLATYDMEYLQELIDNATEDLESSKRIYETQILNNKLTKDPIESANEGVIEAENNKEKAKAELAKAKVKYEKAIKKIEENLTKEQKDEYDKALKLLNDADETYSNILKECETSIENAEESLEELKQLKESEVKTATQNLEDAKFSLEQLVGDYNNMITALNNYQDSVKVYNIESMQKNLAQLMIAYFGYAEFIELTENADEENANTDKFTSILMAASNYEGAVSSNDSEREVKCYLVLKKEVTDIYQVSDSEKYKAEQAVERLTEKLNDTKVNYDKKIAKQQEEIINLKAENDKKIEKAQENVKEQTKHYKEILNKVYEDEEGIENITKIYDQAKEVYEAADDALTAAKDNLKTAKNNDIYLDRINELNLENLRYTMERKQKKLEELQKIYDFGGKLNAPKDGVIDELGIMEHSKTTGEEKVSISSKDCHFQGELSEEAIDYITEGNTMTCMLNSEKKELTLTVTRIWYDRATNKNLFTASLPEGEYTPGHSGKFYTTKKSGTYDTCVPIEAIRRDFDGNNYILTVIDKSSILGDNKTVFRMNVNVINSDYKMAAIQDAISKDTIIITGSNNMIEEGDRVRVK